MFQNIYSLPPDIRELWCRRYAAPTPYYHAECRDCGQSHENMRAFVHRVSFGNPTYAEMIEALEFLPNSPTLFSAGLGSGTLSACFVLNIGDSMTAIGRTVNDALQITKQGGGIGYYLSNLRPRGAAVGGSAHRVACGPVEVMRLLHSSARLVTQGGRRQAAQMAVLDADHQDIAEFIRCKDEDPQALSTFNISVRATTEQLSPWLMQRVAESAWKTGDPGLIFADTVHQHQTDPENGEWLGSNPCGEQMLPHYGSCNLGSISLPKFVCRDSVTGAQMFDMVRFGKTVRKAVCYLDEVITRNRYPVPEIAALAQRRRNIGLGVMGFADTLQMLGLRYDSDQGRRMAKRIAEVLRENAVWASGVLGQEYEVRGRHAHNATLISIAPTGTISLLAGVSSGIEPHFAEQYSRITGDGQVIQQHGSTETAHDVSVGGHVSMAGIWTQVSDTGVSKTINLPNSASVRDVKLAFELAQSHGLMAVSVFRDGCRDEQVLGSKLCPACEKPMVKVAGCWECRSCLVSLCG